MQGIEKQAVARTHWARTSWSKTYGAVDLSWRILQSRKKLVPTEGNWVRSAEWSHTESVYWIHGPLWGCEPCNLLTMSSVKRMLQKTWRNRKKTCPQTGDSQGSWGNRDCPTPATSEQSRTPLERWRPEKGGGKHSWSDERWMQASGEALKGPGGGTCLSREPLQTCPAAQYTPCDGLGGRHCLWRHETEL